MPRIHFTAWLFPLFAAAATVLSASAQPSRGAQHPTIDADAGWRALFDGTDLRAWTCRATNGKPTGQANWEVEDGTIARRGGGYLWSNEQFGDFILDMEFKVAPGTNSGIIFRHQPDPEAKRYWWNGLLEMQLLDSAGKAESGMHDCGALYDMIAPKRNAMKPANQWNRVTITAQGSRIHIVMNGQEIIEANLDDWSEANKNPDGTPNKYHRPMKDLSRTGHILLQEHGGSVWFKNIYIKPLD
jgi:hypothetical protein